MDILDTIELHDCPLCLGPSLLEEESGHFVSVSCLDCGCHTASIPFGSAAEREDAARRVAELWNMGKVISEGTGE